MNDIKNKYTSVMTLSKRDFINLCKLSTWEVFENPKHDPLLPDIKIDWSNMCKLFPTSWGLNPLMTGSIIIEL